MSFTRVVEDFTCEHCGQVTAGSGYTNHCPSCLWSKHIDNDPGDRAAACGGMMKPIRIEGSSPAYRIVHRCERCGIERRVNVAATDDAGAIIAIAREDGVARD